MVRKAKTDYQKIVKFVMENKELFTDYEREYLIRYASNERNENRMIPDLVREVYDELNLLSKEDNIYLGFIDLLDKEFNYKEKKIVEVGGGIFPCLAKRIAPTLTSGTIKVYDPRLNLKETDSEKLTLVREKFYSDTPVNNTDLIMGFMPCEATYNIIDCATRNNIDFIIALCEGGLHGDIYDYFETEEDWLNAMIYMAECGVEDHNMGTLEKVYLKEYHDPYPVIYNKRKEEKEIT